MKRGQFALTGTLLVEGKNTAFLREIAGNKARRVHAGETINGMKVAEVKADRVTLTLGDESEELVLKVATNSRPTPQPSVAAPAAPTAAVAAAPAAPPGATGSGRQGGAARTRGAKPDGPRAPPCRAGSGGRRGAGAAGPRRRSRAPAASPGGQATSSYQQRRGTGRNSPK